jgi:hypothetical protein
MDWASEIEQRILRGSDHAIPLDGEIAAALRKAMEDGEAKGERKGRAAGMREAVVVGLGLPKAEHEPFASGFRYAVGLFQDAILRRASQIEKGN